MDKYDVLPLPTHIGAIFDKEQNKIKPIVAVYFPAELLEKMKWSPETRLTLTVEKDSLKIVADPARAEIYFYSEPGELTYEPLDEI